MEIKYTAGIHQIKARNILAILRYRSILLWDDFIKEKTHIAYIGYMHAEILKYLFYIVLMFNLKLSLY